MSANPSEWKDGRRDYGDGWEGAFGDGWFSLDRDEDAGVTLDGTPADCDILHACLVALRERPEVLRAALGLGGETRGRTVRAECDAMTYANGAWWATGACSPDNGRLGPQRPQRIVVDLLLPEEPPTVVGRVEPIP